MERYTKLNNSRYAKQLNEYNHCTVIATAIAARMSYKEAHTLLSTAGRVNGRSFNMLKALTAIQQQGFKCERVKELKQKTGSRYTQKSIGDKLKRGYYIVRTNEHAFAMVNGIVEDWSLGRKYHILDAWKITRIKGFRNA